MGNDHNNKKGLTVVSIRPGYRRKKAGGRRQAVKDRLRLSTPERKDNE